MATSAATAAKASARLKPHLDAIAKAARQMKETSVADMKNMRKALGEVSRGVVALLAAEPRLTEGRHVFECGMADGYQKWVQTESTISNPYMGKRMPACGTASTY